MASRPVTMHPRLNRLLNAWTRASLEWCFLRVPLDLVRPKSDLDLLLDPADLEAAVALAEKHGFARMPGAQPDTHLILYEVETATWLWLHCVTELTFGPGQAVRGDPAAAVLARRAVGPAAVLGPEDEFWVTLAHCLLDRRETPMHHRHRLETIAAHATTAHTVARRLGELLPGDLSGEDLLRASRMGAWGRVEELRPALNRACIRGARLRLPERAGRRLRRLPATLAEARLRRGIGLALLGPDGAGKSTLAAGIENTFPLPVRRVYMGLTGGMLHWVDRLRIPGVVRVGRLSVIWARYLRGQYHIARGRLVVFDRYIYDAEVPTPHHLGPIGRLGRWIDGHSCPRPDLVVLLDAPGALLHERKGEYDPKILELWRQCFLTLKRRLPDLLVVDATQGTDCVQAEVIHRVWELYAARWRGR